MENLFIETRSPYNFDQSIEKLSEIILTGGWNISVTLDLQASLSKSGIETLPVKVIELCHPKLASQILQNNDTRVFSGMLPCKLSVYLKDDGKTYISMMNSVLVASQIGGPVEKIMTEAFLQVENFIHLLIEE